MRQKENQMNVNLNRVSFLPVQKAYMPDRRKMSKNSPFNDDDGTIYLNHRNPMDKMSFTSSSKVGSKLNYMA